MLDSYSASDVTSRAKQVAAALPSGAPLGAPLAGGFPPPPQRCPSASGLHAGMKVSAARASVRFGELAELDLSGVEQIVEHSQARRLFRHETASSPAPRPHARLSYPPSPPRTEQVRAIGDAMVRLAAGPMNGSTCVDELLRFLAAEIEELGLDALKPGWRAGNLAAPRMLEVGAALSRLRSLAVPQTKKRARAGGLELS